jgi:hypothetical protein
LRFLAAQDTVINLMLPKQVRERTTTGASLAPNLKGRHMKNIDPKIFIINSPAAKRLGRLLAVPALLLGLTTMASAADDNGCSDGTLKGDYGFTINGIRPILTAPKAQPEG